MCNPGESCSWQLFCTAWEPAHFGTSCAVCWIRMASGSYDNTSASKLPWCPPLSLEHIILQRCEQRESWGCRTARCPEVCVWSCVVCPRSLHTLKATQPHQELHVSLQLVTCLHNPAPLQILPLTLPDKANGAAAYKRHTGSWCRLATWMTGFGFPASVHVFPDHCWSDRPCYLLCALPGSLQAHPAFHVSILKPHHAGPFYLQQPCGHSSQGTSKSNFGLWQSKFWILPGWSPSWLQLPPQGACPGTSKQDTGSSPDLGFPQQVFLKTQLSGGCGAHKERRLLSGFRGTHGP